MKSRNTKGIIAVISGAGDLPARVIEKLKELGLEFVVLSIKGFGSPQYPQFNIGEIGRMLDYVKSRGVTEIIFCGAVKRPSMFSMKLDNKGKQWLKKLGLKAFCGDNALLTGIKNLLINEGLSIKGPQEILSTLLTPAGILTETKPSEMDLEDIARGVFVLNTMSKTDVGQALVVQEGIVLSIEAAEGTSEMLKRTKHLKLSETRGGVLVKLAKIGQDQSLDLPTVGAHTIIEANEANIAGIALGAHKTQIIDYKKTIELANESGIFMIGI